MMRTRTFALALALWSCCAARITLAESSVYESIPDEALGFAIIQNPAAFDSKLSALAGRLRLPPQFSHPVMLAKAAAGLNTAFDDAGSVAVVLMPNAGKPAQPSPVVLAPVTDYEQFVTALSGNAKLEVTDVLVGGQLVHAAKRGRFAALASRDHREALERLVAAKAVSAESLASLKAWLAPRDVVLVARTEGVKLLVGQIRQGLETTLKALPANAPEAQTVRTVFQAYDKMLTTAQEECQTFAAGLNVDGSGAWHLTTRTALAPTGSIAAVVKSLEPLEGGALAGLPDGPFVFAFGGVLPANFSRSFMDLSIAAIRGNPAYKGISDDDLKTLSEAQMAMTTGLVGVAGSLGVAAAKQPLYSGFVGTLHVRDSAKFLANYREKSAAVRDLMKGKNAPGVITDVESIQVGDVSGLAVTTDMSAALAGGPPQSRELIEQMFGPGGKVKVFLAAADQRSVVMTYINQNNLAKGLAAFRASDASLAGSKQVSQTQPLLPADAQWEGYLSVSGAIQWMQQILTVTLPPQAQPQIPAFGDAPPLGLAVKAADNLIESDLVLPSATIDAIGAFAAKMRGAP